MVKGRKNFYKKGLGRRLLSMTLALVMSFMMFASELPFGLLQVKAEGAPTNVTLHFNNSNWNWGQPGLQYWGGSSTTVNDGTTASVHLDDWNVDAYPLTACDDTDCYSITLKGDFEGFQFVDLYKAETADNRNSTGGIYHSLMAQFNGDEPQELYFNTDDKSWYYDVAYNTPLVTVTYDVTFHWYNSTNWEEVAFYTWESNGELVGGWPGGLMTANEEKNNWYDISFADLKSGDFQFIMNNNNNNLQTNNLSVSLEEGQTDVWVMDGGNTIIAGVATDAPDLWINPPSLDDTASDGDSNDDTNNDTNVDTDDNANNGDTEEEVQINTSYYAKDVMAVKVGETTYPMNVLVNGIYQTDVVLPAGEYTGTLIKNGETTDVTTTIAVEGETNNVYFRLYDNDNLTSGVVASCAAVGTLKSLAGDPYADWDPADADAELTYVGDGFYMGQITYESLEADKPFEYKVAFNDGWDWNIGVGGGNGANFARTAPAGSTGFTVYVDSINNVVYDSLTTDKFSVAQNSGAINKQPFVTAISIIGGVREGNAEWEAGAKGFEFTQISDTLYRYEKTFANAGEYPYKCVFDYTNWYEAEGGNRVINLTSPNTHVVFLYDTKTGYLYDTVNNEAEVAKRLHMNVRPSGMQVVENLNGTTTFIVPAQDGAQVTLYYADKSAVEANGSAAFKKTVAATANGGVARFDSVWLGDVAKDVVYYYDVAGMKVIDETEAVTVGDASYSLFAKNGYTGRDVYVPGTFPGPSWDAGSNKMTYVGNQKYTYTFKDVPAAKYEHKISIAASWSENYGVDGIKDGANIGVTVGTKQDVTIYYNDISHRAVNSIDYKFVDVALTGTGITDGTKLTDDELTGIYTAKVALPAGTYSDIAINYDGNATTFNSFTLKEEKEVTFCLDPITGLCYHNASNVPMDTDSIYYDSKDASYKSVYGALATGETVTFALTTGEDVVTANLLIKGVANKAVPMEKDGDAVDGKQKWSATTSFDTIGEYTYYFAVSNGASVAVYGDDDGYYGTGMVSELTNVKPYDLVVYKAGFETPDWMKNAVIYQIFPDRFFDGDESNNKAQTTARGAVDYEFVEDWFTLPENPEQEGLLSESAYKATGAFYGDGQWSNEIYGGDLKGITEKIDYLKALGVTVIYLNPVFSSISSHRYDACDYTKIDPILGTEGDFKELVEVAERNGMKVVLDGVFNHVSDDSIYFDRYYKFLDDGLTTIGAYPYWAYVYDYMAENGVEQQVAEEEAKEYFTAEYGITDYSYVEWFDVFTTTLKDGNSKEVFDTIGLRTDKPVYGYDGWWGYDSMPIIKSTNGSEYQTGNWAEHIIYNEDETSVTQYWISEGMDGWRLDVANEVSDETWQRFRESVKGLDSEAVIIGEIWDDATKYILGDMYDSVMNYMFRNAVTNFAMGSGSTDVTKYMERLRERYPKEAFYAMMNLVGSHDTTRILSYLDGVQDDRNQKDVASAFPTYAATSDTAKQRQYLVAFLQFTYAGAPTIYYGDEIGMVGADDPDDRRAFEWGKGNEALVTYYATLADVRSKYAALRTGEVESFATGSENVLGYVRRDAKDEIIVLANNSASAVTVTVDVEALNVSADKLSDLLTNNIPNTVEDGEVTITVPAYRGVILVDDNKVKALTVDKKALACAYKTVAPVPTPSKPSHVDDDKHENKPVATPAPTVAPQVTATPVATPEVKPVLPTEPPKKPELPKVDFSGIKDVKEQVEAIIEVLKDIEEHTDVVIAIETTPEEKKAEISLEVLNVMSGKKEADVNLVIELDNGFSWTIDSSSIDSSVWADGAETIDFWAGVVEDVIPKETLKEVVKEEQKMIEISLNHEGDFGLNAALDIPVGDEFEGKEAVLYYYNEAKSALEEQGRGKVGVDGKVNFLFTHASDYVIVIEDEVPTAETPITENVAVGGTTLAEGAVEEVTMNGVHPMVYVFIIIAVLAFGAGAVIIKKKNSSLED